MTDSEIASLAKESFEESCTEEEISRPECEVPPLSEMDLDGELPF